MTGLTPSPPVAVALLVILGMAAVTYLTQALGLAILSRVRPTPGLEAFLRHMPGAILVSIVAPGLAAGGPTAWGAGLAAALTAARTGNLVLTMLVGVVVAALLRALAG